MDLPKQYDIEELLNSAVQPFPAASDEWITTVSRDLKRSGGDLPAPVTVTSDGILIDGSQRLTAMLRAGRKIIMSSDVRVLAEANSSNALEYAIKLNVSRRHLTMEEKADFARKLQRERRWSQAQIARAFGVSRPAVSQWLKKVPDPEPETAPTFIEGRDGKRYIRDEPPAPPRDEEPVNPWHPTKGRAAKAAKSFRHLLSVTATEPPTGLTDLQKSANEQVLQDIMDMCEEALTALNAGR